MPSIDEFIQGKVKGRVALFLDNAYQLNFHSFGLGFVGAAAPGDALQVNDECFALWKRYVALPDGATILRVYYSFLHHQWLLIIESDHLPPHRFIDTEIGQAVSTNFCESDQLHITDIQPITMDDARYKWPYK